MDKLAVAKKYFNNNPKPVQEICPEFNQYFRCGSGYVLWNSKTGRRTEIYFDPTRWDQRRQYPQFVNVIPTRSMYEGLYIHYISELDALEISYIVMEGNRGRDGVKKEWKYEYSYGFSRSLVFRDDPNAYTNNKEMIEGGKYYCKQFIHYIKMWLNRAVTDINTCKEVQKFDDKANIEYYGNYSYSWRYIDWYQKSFIKRNKSQNYKNLTAYEFDTPDFELDDNQKTIYFQILDDQYAVLRIFDPRVRWNYEQGHRIIDDEKNEVGRLFISNKGKPTLMEHWGNEWRITSTFSYITSGTMEVVNPELLKEWKPLRYVLDCMEDITLPNIVNILRHPIIEQLYKAGYKHTALTINRTGTITQTLKDYFLIEKERKLPLFKLLGCNKFLLNEIENTARSNRYGGGYAVTLDLARELKYLEGKFDVSDASEQTIHLLATYLIADGNDSITELFSRQHFAYWWYRKHRYDDPLTDEQRNWIIKLLKMNVSCPGSATLYKDVIRTYNSLDEKPEIDLQSVKSIDDIQRMHDALVALKVQQDAERQARYNEQKRIEMEEMKKKFDKLQEEREAKFNYEDDSFCIRVPKSLEEITAEGISLGHCVGGYLNKHASGDTNILFLRRKGMENSSFYTIEINKDDRVVQIHGSHNRWLGNNPEAVPFVYKYMTEKGFNFTTKMLLNKGAGYSAGSEELDESYLTAA